MPWCTSCQTYAPAYHVDSSTGEEYRTCDSHGGFSDQHKKHMQSHFANAVIAAAGDDWESVNLSSVKKFILSAVAKNGCYLRYASDGLKNDKEVVMEACNSYGYALTYASGPLKGDREVVLAACNSHGLALGYASGPMRNNKGGDGCLQPERGGTQVCTGSFEG